MTTIPLVKAQRTERKRLLSLRRTQKDLMSPIKAREEEDFLFAEVAKEMGYLDPERARDFYRALIRVTIRLLRKDLIVRWPGFVDAFLLYRESKTIVSPKSPFPIHVGPHYELRFTPAKRLREYFSRIQSKIIPK
jgi:nucleoid DNA-binding protein